MAPKARERPKGLKSAGRLYSEVWLKDSVYKLWQERKDEEGFEKKKKKKRQHRSSSTVPGKPLLFDLFTLKIEVLSAVLQIIIYRHGLKIRCCVKSI